MNFPTSQQRQPAAGGAKASPHAERPPHADDLVRLIEALPDPLFVRDGEGALQFANRRAREVMRHAPEEIHDYSLPSWGDGEIRQACTAGPDGPLAGFERRARPITWNGAAAWLVTLHDTTAAKALERQLTRTNRLYSALGQAARVSVRATSEADLFEDVCRIAVAFGGFRLARIVRPDVSGEVMVDVARAGPASGHLNGFRVKLDPSHPDGQGPAARTYRLGVPYVSNDFLADSLTKPWHASAREHGLGSLASFPVAVAGMTDAVWIVYAGETNYFDSTLLNLLGQMAAEIGGALERLAGRAARRRAERALAESEALFRQMAAVNRQVFWMWDAGTQRLLYVSPAYETVFGRSMAEAPQDQAAWLEQVHPEDRPGLERKLGRGKSDRPTTLSYRIVRPDGVVRWVRDEIVPIVEGGRVVRLAGNLSDVTEETLAQAALRRHEEQLRSHATLLDEANDAIVLRSLQDVVLFWNRSAERLFGWSRAEAVGRKITELHFRDGEALGEPTRIVRAAGAWQGEVALSTRAGHSILVTARWTLVHDSEGRPNGVLAINTDITERRRMEDAVVRSQRLESIGTLAGGIAHDLNNILSPILLSADMLASSVRDASARECVETIATSARRGAEVVRQVLAFSGGLENGRVPVDFGRLLGELARFARETFPRKIRFETEVAPDLHPVLGDLAQIHQMVLNLCVNARDAMPEGGTIRVEVANVDRRPGGTAAPGASLCDPWIRLRVSDTGPGVPEAIRAKIFEPLFSTKTAGRGTGLGLSAVAAIAARHGGAIELECPAGAGSNFDVYLPGTEVVPAPPAAVPATQAPGGRGELILVIEDEASVRTMTQRGLESSGYRVITAGDGAEGVDAFSRHRDDVALVLTDLMMPVMDGLLAIRTLRKLAPDLRIIAMSGVAEDSGPDAAMAPADGPVHFLFKPFTLDSLLGEVRATLDRPVGDAVLDPAAGI